MDGPVVAESEPQISLKLTNMDGRFPLAVSMGRRNTRLKPNILVFAPEGFVGAS